MFFPECDKPSFTPTQNNMQNYNYVYYNLYINNSICQELWNTEKTDFYTYKECHKTESLSNHTTTGHKEEEQLEDLRNVGESSCNPGDGTDQRVQFLMFMMMIICTFLGCRQEERF
jgi:hypothetical protein